MANEKNNILPLSEYMDAERILIFPGKQEKDDILNALIDTLADLSGIDGRDDIARGIFHRESLLSTGIGNGIALPHVRLNDLDKIYVAAAIIPEGIEDYGSLDEQPVRFVFMVVAGKERKTIHVNLLRSITKLLSAPATVQALLTATEPEACMELIRQSE